MTVATTDATKNYIDNIHVIGIDFKSAVIVNSVKALLLSAYTDTDKTIVKYFHLGTTGFDTVTYMDCFL